MKKMKTFFGWFVFLVLFIIISEVIINIALNSSYKNLSRKDTTEGVNVYQAEATYVNGRIRGIVENTGNPDIEGKFLRVDIYSERDVILGTKYIDLTDLKKGENKPFEIFYKFQNTSYYNISIVDEQEQVDDSGFLINDLTKRKVMTMIIAAIIFK